MTCNIYTSIILLFSFSIAVAQVQTYPVPDSVPISDQYKVEIVQNNKTFACMVPIMHAKWKTNNSKTTSWASFGFKGQVIVKVTRLQGGIDYCKVLPGSKNIDVKTNGNIAEFTINEPGQFSVEFQSGIKIDHPLLIFADSLHAAPPLQTDKNLVYFGPGIHEIGKRFEITSGQTIYLAPGAYVKGQMYAENQQDIKIIGQGILSGEQYAARSHNHMITMHNCNNVLIEGITIIEAPRYNIAIRGKHQVVRNVKMMGWWFSTDGVVTGYQSLVEDCFFKVNDDAIKLYHSGTTARNCVIWQMENGAPFQISWNMPSNNAGFHVYNMDIIRVEHEWDNPNEAVFCAIHGSKGHMSDYVFENIRIENTTWRVFHLITKPNRFATWDENKGNVSDIVFRDISISGHQRLPSLIKGHDEKHKIYNISFENVKINGRPFHENLEENIVIDSLTTYNISFQ